MIKFFKYSGAIQFMGLFLLLLALRMPLFFSTPPLLSEDLKHLVVGERMAEGHLMYRDIIDTTPPVAAYIYMCISYVVGRSGMAFYIIAILFIFFQAVLFRVCFNGNNLFSENGDIPSLVYIVFSFLCFDFLSLSPALISVTFLLLAFNSIFKHLKASNSDGEIFAIGFYLGLAYLTYLPCLVFLLITIVVFLSSSSTSLRYYLLLIMGFLFPIIFILTIFFLNNGSSQFIQYYILDMSYLVKASVGFNPYILFIIIMPSVMLCTFGIIRALTYRRFIIYQIIGQRIMFLTLMVIIGLIYFLFYKSTTFYVMLIPFVAFFITHFLHSFKKPNAAGFIFFLYLIYTTAVCYSYIFPNVLAQDIVNFNHQLCFENKWNTIYKNKKVMSLGGDMSIYINNRLASPYLDWHLSQKIFTGLNDYSQVLEIYNDFKTDLPDVIVDENKVLPLIQDKIPYLKPLYQLKHPSIYIKNR